ncbi:MAG: hypothetical protein H6Q21_2267, partial [Bacteroidetes bacterium]|nr:hypothetical protein [Bacteroidota bacterium]
MHILNKITVKYFSAMKKFLKIFL